MSDPGKVQTGETPVTLLWRLWRQGQRVDLDEFLTGCARLEATDLVAALLIDQAHRRPLGERIPAEAYLRRYPEVAAHTEAAVELIYGEFLLREQDGERPQFQEYQWRFPDLAPRLRQQIELYRALQGNSALKVSSVVEAGQTTPSERPADGTAIPKVPGYEVLGELGRGGMGVVYKAHQVGLNRLCALKVILYGGHAGDADLQRFHNEAEAIARLQHPNIVGVYEIGQYEGTPFFSLEFCSGGSLDRKLGGTPLPVHEAAALVQTLAGAMQAAHQANVIHRDLKPANVLLTADGTPKITDFGLAKKLDEGVGPTLSGAVMGTPSYMAPEQAGGKGRQIGPAADVYALGAILYELLTGRPPFKAATPFDTLMQVIEDEPVPPRRLNARVPADLETICLKCLRKEPSHRYGGAKELAADLGRFLAGEPVRARPVGMLERGWRWCKRRPAVAALSGSVLALLAGLVVVSVASAIKSSQALKTEQSLRQDAERLQGEAEQQRGEAEQQRRRAEGKQREAEQQKERAQKAESETLADYRASTDDAIQQLIGSKPELGPREKAYLEMTLKRWQAYAARTGGDKRSRAIRAEGEFRIAYLRNRLGQKAEALAGYREAVAQWEKLAHEFPTVPPFHHELARSHHALGHLLEEQNQWETAAANYYKALAIRQKLAKDFPTMPEFRHELARSHNVLGPLLTAQNQPDKAAEHYREALVIQQKLADDFPTEPEYREELAKQHNNLATLLAGQSQADKAAEHYGKALAIKQKLADDFPAVLAYRQDLARSYNNLGVLLKSQNQPDKAAEQYRKALAIQQKLADDFPALPAYQVDLGAGCCNFGHLLRNSGKPADSLPYFDRAVAALSRVHQQNPRGATPRLFLRNSHWGRAQSYDLLHKHAEAVKDWTRTIELSPPQELAWLRVRRADARVRAGQVAEAVAEVAEMAKTGRLPAGQWYDFACIHAVAADKDAARKKEYADQALELLHKAVKAGYKDATHMAGDKDLDVLRGRDDFKRLMQSLPKPTEKKPTPER